MTPQEMFDRAYAGVMAQGYPSLVDGSCAYDDGKGGACAVGHLLSPNKRAEWERKWGGKSAWQITKHYTRDAPQWLLDNCDLLDAIQDAHDGACCKDGNAFKSAFHGSMASVAAKFGLTCPEYEA